MFVLLQNSDILCTLAARFYTLNNLRSSTLTCVHSRLGSSNICMAVRVLIIDTRLFPLFTRR